VPCIRWLLVLTVLIATAALSSATAGAGDVPDSEVVGTEQADHLRGTTNDDVVRGLGGDDRLVGGAGADALYGMNGDDKLVGGANPDQLYGGAGDDHIDARDATGDTADDRARVPEDICPFTTASRCLPLPENADVINGGSGNDVINARDGKPDAILCGPGQDLVRADPDDLFSPADPGSQCETIRD
jgi:Ca2+-binding RTX toxin-like protein